MKLNHQLAPTSNLIFLMMESSCLHVISLYLRLLLEQSCSLRLRLPTSEAMPSPPHCDTLLRD